MSEEILQSGHVEDEKLTGLIPAYRDTFVHFLFATPGNEFILLDFVNAVLDNSNQPLVKKVESTNPFNPQTFVTDKYSILDVKATDDDGGVFIVEFQTTDRAEFARRFLYYCCKSYCLQINEGNSYSKLNLVIGIAVTSFLLRTDLVGVHNPFNFVAKSNPEAEFTDEGIQIHILEVTKEKLEDFCDLNPPLRAWVDFFYYSHLKSEAEMSTLLNNAPVVLGAYERYRHFNKDERLRQVDAAHQRYLHDYATDTEAAHKKGVNEGIEKGIEQGIKKGIEQGIEQGIKKGIVETARSLKSLGISIHDIAQATKLSVSAIEEL